MTEASLPRSWERKTLSEVCGSSRDSVVDGPFGSNLKRSDFVESGRPVLKIQNVKPNQIVLKNMDFVSEEKFQSLARHSFSDNDIVMTKLGDPLGVAAIVDGLGPGVIVADLVRIRPTEINTRFLCHQLNSPSVSQSINDSQKGTTRPRVNLSMVRQIRLSVPPLEEQAEIVRILEEQFSRLDAAAASIAAVRRKADQFRRSLLNAAFSEEVTVCPPGSSERQVSWKFQRLGDCLEKLKSGKIAERGWSPQCLSHPSDEEGSWGVLKTTAVQMGEFQPEHNKELPKTLTPKTGLEVEDGDFLLITTSPRNRCGVVCQVKNTRKKLIFSGKILRFRVDEERVLADWLMYYLMSPKSQEELNVLKVGTSDSSVSIGNKQVLDLMIPIAPIDVQRLVASLLDDEMTRLVVLLQTARTAEVRIAALRRSLLNSAFSGELTREWREKNNG